MPMQVISKCTDGTVPVGALPACLPMSEFTWYIYLKQQLNPKHCIPTPPFLFSFHDVIRGYTVGAFALGGMAGSLATVYLNQWFGRRDNIMISCGWFIVGGILSACAINIGMVTHTMKKL